MTFTYPSHTTKGCVPLSSDVTRDRTRYDTVLKNYPLYCPKCKQETLIEAENLKVTVIKKQEN